MAGVYGEFLGFFPELFEQFRVFKQEPDVVSGYKLEYHRTVQGVRQTNNIYVDENRKKQLPLMDIVLSYWLWTYDKIDPATEFVEIDGKMFRPMSESLFNREGGFYETRLDSVVGNDGTKDETPELTEGKF